MISVKEYQSLLRSPSDYCTKIFSQNGLALVSDRVVLCHGGVLLFGGVLASFDTYWELECDVHLFVYDALYRVVAEAVSADEYSGFNTMSDLEVRRGVDNG